MPENKISSVTTISLKEVKVEKRRRFKKRDEDRQEERRRR